MALNRSNKYPGRFSPPTTARPQGAFKNRTSPTAQDGSYLEADWANDWDGFFARILNVAGISPNGTVDSGTSSQYFDALVAAIKVNLGTAAVRNVGIGVNQIPDMNSFQAGQGWQKLPGGTIIQQGTGSAGRLGNPNTIPLPIGFSDVTISQVVACYDNPQSGLTLLPAFATRVNAGGATFDLMHSSSSTATIFCRWVAVGK